MRTIVIGAGVGGVAVALGLQQRGLDVSVFEQASAVTTVGAGLIIAPNSHRLLSDEWGIDAVPSGVQPPTLHLRRWQDGRTISEQPLGAVAVESFGAPYVAMHRADLLDALAAKLEPGTVNLRKRLTGLVQDDGGVTVAFEDGTVERADLAIAADGTRSAAAAALGESTVARPSGYAAYRGFAPKQLIEDVGESHNCWLGPNSHFVHYPISGGELLNFVAIVPTSRQETEAWSSPGEVTDVRRAYTGWDPRVRRILEATDAVTLWGLYDRPVRDRLDFGRVVLLGDAAHPVLPFFAQGASLALEDAAVLSALIADAAVLGLDRVLPAYSRVRVPRIRKVQDASFRNATMFHLPDGPEQRQRDAFLGAPDSPSPLRANAWLFGHDVRDDVAAVRAELAAFEP